MSNSPFLNSIRTDMRQKGYALKTEKTYLHWIKRFILFHKKRHPQTMGSEEVRLFLSSLANSRHVAINTQKIALNALAFLYNRFLHSRWAILIISLQASLDGYPLLSLQMKCNAFCRLWILATKLFLRCCMVQVCALMNACVCGLKILILIMAASLCMTVRVGKAETAYCPRA
ncbi:phage integrase N-terminal SAM-like domain-containing protein [Proteus mirabilis]|nr:phage integrase N-terminal SAM-like domain-containing protein [Proteus mirabilis]EMF0770075.1 phage integrase N-terminal SAM-like domain-containing protein [Proteus mirabilis]